MSSEHFKPSNTVAPAIMNLVPLPILLIEAAEQGMINVARTQHTYPLKNHYRLCHDIAYSEVETSINMPKDEQGRASIRCLLAGEIHYTIENSLTEEEQNLIHIFRDASATLSQQYPSNAEQGQSNSDYWRNILTKQENLTDEKYSLMQEAYDKLCTIAMDRMKSLHIRFPHGVPIWPTILQAIAKLN